MAKAAYISLVNFDNYPIHLYSLHNSINVVTSVKITQVHCMRRAIGAERHVYFVECCINPSRRLSECQDLERSGALDNFPLH